MASTTSQKTQNDAQTNGAASNGNGAGFDAAFLSAPIVTAQAKTVKAAAQPKNKRSAAQLALDAVTPQIHQAWVKAGKPAAFGKLPTVSYPVDPEKATKLKGMIRKAADINETRARFGQDVTITKDMIAELPQLNDSHEGLTLVTFGVMDKSKPAQTDKPAE
jgi:hypothetical protein